MNLSILWFWLIAVLWIGYLVLEGFDFGVGMLTSILPRGDYAQKDRERRLLVNTIGPHWDGNEVWLLTAGGATFAAFPEWYATLFSGFYLPLLLILLALIIRGVSFEYRGKINDPRWSKVFEWGVIIGSWLPSFLWGVAFANLVRGVLLDGNHQYIGGFWALLNPFALLGGIATTVLFLLHGSLFVALKTYGEVHHRALKFAKIFALIAIVGGAIWLVWAQLAYSVAWTWLPLIVAALSLIGVLALVMKHLAAERGAALTGSAYAGSVNPAPANVPPEFLVPADSVTNGDGFVTTTEPVGLASPSVAPNSAVILRQGADATQIAESSRGTEASGNNKLDKLAFALSALALMSLVVFIFGSMYPDVMPGLHGGYGLSITEATSTPYTLRVMTIVALALTPLVLAYQIWTFWVFRRRLSTRDIPAPTGLSWQRLRQAAF